MIWFVFGRDFFPTCSALDIPVDFLSVLIAEQIGDHLVVHINVDTGVLGNRLKDNSASRYLRISDDVFQDQNQCGYVVLLQLAVSFRSKWEIQGKFRAKSWQRQTTPEWLK